MPDKRLLAAGPARRLTVVLIEDHLWVRVGVTNLLNAAGFDVITAAGTSRDGHAAIVAHRLDIAVIDDRLPDGSGVDLCRALAHDAPDVPTIIYATIHTPDDELQAREAGAAAILAKTLNACVLVDAITRVSSRRNRRLIRPAGSGQGTAPAT